MKFFIVLALSLVTTSVFAVGKVNDKAVYNYVIPTVGDLSLTQELISFDEAAQTFVLQETMVMNGETTVESRVIPASETIGAEEIATILSQCSEAEGKIESVTVAAGTFEVCTLTTEEGTASIGNVPFGIVKFAAPQFSLELKDMSPKAE